jgi:amidase
MANPRNVGSVHSIDVLTADVKTLHGLLAAGKGSSRLLVELYLSQIRKHDGRLHATIETAPLSLLVSRAEEMDKELEAGQIRGPLHGIPIIIKVSVHMQPYIYQ